MEEIPKIIHYCWFGRKPKPDLAVKCIESWKKFFPDYEIKEWNEENWDINCCQYVREAYDAKKWAFVSDYARFDILYRYGGIYFDTDVEVIKPMEDILNAGSFMGLEEGRLIDLVSASNSKDYYNKNLSIGKVNPGLGMAAVPGLDLFGEIISQYKKRHFKIGENKYDVSTVVEFVTGIIIHKKIEMHGSIAKCEGINIYEKDYFCPKDYITGELNVSANTRTIHHYTASWITPTIMKIVKIRTSCKKKYGEKLGNIIGRVITVPLSIKNKALNITDKLSKSSDTK